MNYRRLHRMLVGNSKDLKRHSKIVYRYGTKMTKCQQCGQYFPLDKIEAHHSIISFSEVKNEFVRNRLSKNDARSILRSTDNIQLVCNKCHRKLHKIHYHN